MYHDGRLKGGFTKELRESLLKGQHSIYFLTQGLLSSEITTQGYPVLFVVSCDCAKYRKLHSCCICLAKGAIYCKRGERMVSSGKFCIDFREWLLKKNLLKKVVRAQSWGIYSAIKSLWHAVSEVRLGDLRWGGSWTEKEVRGIGKWKSKLEFSPHKYNILLFKIIEVIPLLFGAIKDENCESLSILLTKVSVRVSHFSLCLMMQQSSQPH